MFKIGDKVKVINQGSFFYEREGLIVNVDVTDNTSKVYFREEDFGEECCWNFNENLERVDDMDISERLSELIKENQNLKQKLIGQNFKLNKIRADVRREHGVSDEEFREAINHFSIIDEDKRYEIWGLINYFDLFAQTSLSEFVNKYKEYKGKQDNEIKVGDVVQLTVKEAIVTAIAGCDAYLLFRDGSSNKFTKDNFTKTSRHYDSIDEFMNS